MPPPDERPEPGQQVADRYVVEQLLGRGGMGAVYGVRDLRTHRKVALKRVWAHDPRKAQQRAALLEREFHTLSQLAHPSIIEVYEYGVDERGPYYTMELLDGADLDKRGRLPWREACALLCDVASSLAILHARRLIHRDVSARNVRCTAAGRAKLIDFGTMAPVGVAKQIVGTPPFIAPETLQLQELDERADLFALGALGYFMATGRHAYPARRVSDLRDVWRSRPAAPTRLTPELPPALDALLLQLLSLDRSARPQSAAEVMERLCAIAGLPMHESAAVSRAYLARPALVGRSAELLDLRRRLLGLMRGDGCAVLVQGRPGSGRSRMLDAVVLEAKVMGATVLRADAGDGAQGDWGVARSLGAQIIELLPKQAQEASRLSRNVLANVIDGFSGDPDDSRGLTFDRSLLLRELRDFVLAICRTERLLIAVDDVDAIDEPSAALLAGLAHKTERRALMLVLAQAAREDTPSQSLRLLQLTAHAIELEHFDPEQTATLLRSVFGDVPNLQIVAERVHALSAGNPRAAMELAQHLCDRGLARYEAGRWSLPHTLDPADLPATLADSLGRVIDALGADARMLADALCLAEGDAIAFEHVAELTGIADRARLFQALGELVAARVLRPDDERYHFAQQACVAVLRERMEGERRRMLHGRLAELLLRQGGEPLRRAHHLMDAGRELPAIELLCSLDSMAQPAPVPLLERAIESAQLQGLPARTVHQLRTALLAQASVVLAAEPYRRCFPLVLARVDADCGLAAYRELADLPEPERLTQALTRTQQRYLATAERERVYPVVDAIRELARLCGQQCGFAMQVIDLDALSALPALAPLGSLSPALVVIADVVEATRHWLRGAFRASAAAYGKIIERIEQPDRGGLDPSQHSRVRAGMIYQVGVLEASLGIARAAQRADALEAEREHRVNAWRVRMLLHLSQGDVAEARRCQRRAELAQLQESSEQRYVGMSAGLEVAPYAAAGDLLGVKTTLESLRPLAAQHPGWRPYLRYAECRYRWLQGDLPGALQAALAGLELAQPAQHNAFAYLAGAHVGLLVELDRAPEAVAVGRAYEQTFERERLVALDHGLSIGLAAALARTGEHGQAIATIERAIGEVEALGAAGLALGTLYEARARIAIATGDHDGCERLAELCAREYQRARNPALASRFARLLEEARQRDLPPLQSGADPRQLLATVDRTADPNSVHSRMLECVDDGDRARCALTLLLQQTESNAGYLYGVRDGHAVPLASLPGDLRDDQLTAWVERRLHAEVHANAATEEGDDGETPSSRYSADDGESFEAVFLTVQASDGKELIAAALALRATRRPRTVLPRELLVEVADELLEHGDVTGLSIEAPAVTRDD